MNIESAVYLLTQMRDEIDPYMFDPDAKAIDTVLRRLAALERVAAAANSFCEWGAIDYWSDVAPDGMCSAHSDMVKALAALRESEGGG